MQMRNFPESGCSKPQFSVAYGHVLALADTAKKVLVCNYGFLLKGSAMSFCNGTHWDRSLGYCEEDDHQTMQCDFEAKNFCEWQTDASDITWQRRNGWTSFERVEYGPKHDHTVS